MRNNKDLNVQIEKAHSKKLFCWALSDAFGKVGRNLAITAAALLAVGEIAVEIGSAYNNRERKLVNKKTL